MFGDTISNDSVIGIARHEKHFDSRTNYFKLIRKLTTSRMRNDYVQINQVNWTKVIGNSEDCFQSVAGFQQPLITQKRQEGNMSCGPG